MKAAIQDYQRMQRDMADFQELVALKSTYDEFSSWLKTYSGQEYIVQRAKMDRLHEEQLAAEREIARLEDEREHGEQKIAQAEAQSLEKQQLHTALIQRIQSDPVTKEREEKNANIIVCTEKIRQREQKRDEQLNLLKQHLSAWHRRLSEVSESPAHEELGVSTVRELLQTLNLFSQYTKENFASLAPLALEEANGKLETLRNAALALQSGWRNQRTEIKRCAEDCRTQLETLKKGVKSYPKDLLALRKFLQDSLSAQYEREVPVHILADLISITDPVWVNVTEGYLRRQKLYILTEPKYYREAVQLLKKYSCLRDQCH